MTIYGKCLEHRLSHIWILRWLEGLTRTEGFSQMLYMPQISTYGIRYVAHIMRLRHQLLFCCRLGSNPRWLFLYHQVKTLINFLMQVKSLNSRFFIQQIHYCISFVSRNDLSLSFICRLTLNSCNACIAFTRLFLWAKATLLKLWLTICMVGTAINVFHSDATIHACGQCFFLVKAPFPFCGRWNCGPLK